MKKNNFYALMLAGALTICGGITAFGTTLYSGIDHAEYLPPISDNHANGLNQRLQSSASQSQYQLALQRGIPQPQFDPPLNGQVDAYHSVPRLSGNAAVSEGPRVEWFRIPNWIAGTWHKQGDLTVSYRDLRTNQFTSMSAWTENQMSSTWGHQYDRAGNVWHADILPIERDGWSKGKLCRFLMTTLTCESTTQQQLITRSRYIVTETYNGTGQIADMFQQESLNHYSILPDGELENISSNRIYSSQGQPLREGGLMTRLQRTAQFTPIRYQNNIDLAQSLYQYLTTHGMSDLAVPPTGAQTQLQQDKTRTSML